MPIPLSETEHGTPHPRRSGPDPLDSHAADKCAARPPADFPSFAEVVGVNRTILGQAELPDTHQLRDRGHLEAALNLAEQAFAKANDRTAGLIHGAAQLAFGISNAQAFLDGNRRTARAVTQTFLANNGLGHLSPVDKEDHQLARLPNRVVAPASADCAELGDFVELFRRREQRRQPRR